MSPNLNTVDDWDQVYDCNTFLQQLPGYNSSEGVDSLLDLSRVINESGNYMWVGAGIPAIPPGVTTNVPAFSTINGSLALPPGTYITSISYYCSKIGGNYYGFKFKLYDKGTKASIFYGDYALDNLVASPMALSLTRDIPFGPAYLKSPFIITPPGNLNWEIVNLGASAVLIQLMCQCAVPINNQSLNTRDIQLQNQ